MQSSESPSAECINMDKMRLESSISCPAISLLPSDALRARLWLEDGNNCKLRSFLATSIEGYDVNSRNSCAG